MPLYTYRCNENDHEFQVRQRMMDDPLTECPTCGGPVRRQTAARSRLRQQPHKIPPAWRRAVTRGTVRGSGFEHSISIQPNHGARRQL